MALTSVTKQWITMGSHRMVIIQFTGDTSTVSLDTGLKKILFSSIHLTTTGAILPQSADSAGVITMDAPSAVVHRCVAIGV